MPRAIFILIILSIISKTTGNNTKGRSSSLQFASYYGDHMVLQRAPYQATIWGFSENVGGQLTVTLSGHQPLQTSVNSNKTWSVKLPAVSDLKNYTITAALGNQSVTISDILFGDVWLCSGEGNMKMTLDMAFNATAEMQDAKNFPNIRLFTAAEESSETPLSDLKGVEEYWSLPSQDTVGHQKWTYFSAVCWLYGKRLYKERKYPIGLVTSAYRNTKIEQWSSPDVLTLCSEGNKSLRLSPPPSSAWNAMIVPLTRMTIYGILWYQGESNVDNPSTYRCLFTNMIRDWRQHFNGNSDRTADSTIPFGFVQLSANGTNSTSGFPELRWHQTADFGYVPNYDMDNVFMATSLDLPDSSSPYGSLYPRSKQDVVDRLLISGLAVAYKKLTSTRYIGPLPDAYFVDIGYRTLGISYDNKSTHLDVRSMDGFEVCCSPNNQSMCNDATSKWMPAPIIEYDAYSVKLWYEACSTSDWVVGLRYEWKETPCTYRRCAIYSKENGLPAAPMLTLGLFGDRKFDRARARMKVVI